MFSINPLQLSLVSSIGGWALNEGVCASKEPLEDFIMVSLVGITGKFVLALGNSILKTVLTVLVVYAFHEWVGEDLVCLTQLREPKVRLGLVLSWIAHWVMYHSKLAVCCSYLLTVSCWVHSESDVVSALVSVHNGRFYFLLLKK